MADKKKRPTMAVTSSHYDSTSQDFHVVNIGESGAQAPRRRSASAGRSESWMAKVTTAMSHRLFSGRRLSGSRSTQVMPMFPDKEHASQETNRGDADERNSSTNSSRRSADRAQALRLVSSEATLPRGTNSFGGGNTEPNPRECPTVVCDIDPYEPEASDEMRNATTTVSKCSVNTIHVRSPQKSSTQYRKIHEKVRPREGNSEWDDVETSELTHLGPASSTKHFLHSSYDEEPAVNSAAPILKDFFSRNATTAHRERAQQRESRRGQHYKSSKERHDRLREQCEIDDQNQAEQRQREKIERLRKLNQQRRIQMRQEASTLKKSVAASRVGAFSRFEAERERWEQDFAAEIDTLGKAYRRAYGQDSASTRPMTVAGLAVPEALTQIQRDAVNQSRRLQTAAPAGWSSSTPPLDGFMMNDATELNMGHLENSKDVLDVFGDGAEINASRGSERWTVEALLAERKDLVERIARLERAMDADKQGVVIEVGKTLIGIEEGFFI